MLLSPIIFFYSFFVLLVFVIGVAPTQFWWRLGGALSARAARWREARLRARLARAAQGAGFAPDIDYLPEGIGLAVESARARLFVAGERGGAVAEAIVPLNAFRACATGVTTGGWSEDYYLELLPAEPGAPRWRISCGADEAVADAVAGRLGALGLARV
jgi:hypothetical protein